MNERWEFKRLVVGIVDLEDFKSIDHWFKVMSDEGWELVSVLLLGKTLYLRELYFKRQIKGHPESVMLGES